MPNLAQNALAQGVFGGVGEVTRRVTGDRLGGAEVVEAADAAPLTTSDRELAYRVFR